MAWKGNPTTKSQSGKGINPAPNVLQETSNLSDIRSPKIQSADTGNVIHDDATPIPLVGPYKKEFATRRDLDKTENFSVDLIDIDTTIIDHMTNRLKISVMDNGSLVTVPILYASPERWKAIKRDGFLRDNQGKILLPAVLINRSNVSNNKDLMTLNRYLSYPVITKFDQKNKYDKFDVLNPNAGKPTKQIYNVTLPDQVIITYDCIIWTDYVDQNNKILEQINFATNDYWGTNNFRFRTRVDDYVNTVELGAGEDRNVKTEFTITVYAYLLPKTMDAVKSTTNKIFTVRKVKIEDKVVGASEIKNQKETANKTENPYAYLKDFGTEYKNRRQKNTDESSVNAKVSTKTGGSPLLSSLKPAKKKTMFRTPPKSKTEYGEDGWLAYDSEYIYLYKSPYGWLTRSIMTFDFDRNGGGYISGYDCDGNPVYTDRIRPINTAFRIFQRFPDKSYTQTPYKSDDFGEEGQISYDGNDFYIYASGQWRRFPISYFEKYCEW